MKNLFNLLVLSCLVLVCVSCKPRSATPREVVIGGKFKMDIPGFMTSTHSINEDASLQYQSSRREDIYALVIEDVPEEVYNVLINDEWGEEYTLDFDGFCKLVGSNEDDAFVTFDDWEDMEEETINGLKAYTFENIRKINGYKSYYKIAFVQGKETFYQVVVWTSERKKERHKEAIEKMISSFAEV